MCTGLEPFLFGAAAAGTGAAATAATTGLIGTAGAFSAGTAALTAGTALTAISGISGARTQSKVLEREAELGRREAQFEEARLREGAEALRGRQRVAAAKAGVAPSGSVLEVMRKSAEEAELEALNIQFGAGAGAQARLFEARQITRAAPVRATGTLLTGAGAFR